MANNEDLIDRIIGDAATRERLTSIIARSNPTEVRLARHGGDAGQRAEETQIGCPSQCNICNVSPSPCYDPPSFPDGQQSYNILTTVHPY